MSGHCEPDGTPCSGGEHRLTCPATCCFVFWRLQADRLGEWDAVSRRLLDRIGSGSAERIDRLVADFNLPRTELRPGTLLTREWDGHLQRIMVLADGFAWNGKTYRSLSKVAFAITGSHWNGPRFFGLRDRPSSEAQP
jgi:hypothetical protein